MTRFGHRTLLPLALLLAVALVPTAASAATLEPIAPVGTYALPIYVTSDPSEPDRLFVSERAGIIKVTEGGQTTQFADLRRFVVDLDSERGFFSVAVPPDHPETGRVFVSYTNTGGDLTLAQLSANSSGVVPTDQAPRVLTTVEHSANPNHNGGLVVWGADGYLYWSTGDGGGSGDPFDSGQDISNRLGKILRLDPATGGPAPGNPFGNSVWSYGLRNPWRFSFDRATGDLLIGDVGQNEREEINFLPAALGAGRAANFGWDCREGLIAYPGSMSPACAGASGLIDPILDYPHDDPGGGAHYGCSITGGYVVRDPTLTTLFGRYVYADLCRGQVRSLTPRLPRATDDRAEGLPVSTPTSFGEDACGRVYVVANGGRVARFTEGAPAPCPTLTVAVQGSGRVDGSVIACPVDCHESLPLGGPLTFTASTTRPGVAFDGWTGACAGQGPTCAIDLRRDLATTARFSDAPPAAPRVKREVLLTVKRAPVPKGARATLVARVRGCAKANPPRVILRRDGKPFGSQRARGCKATFRPRIRSAHRFKALVRAAEAATGDVSRPIRVAPGPQSRR